MPVSSPRICSKCGWIGTGKCPRCSKQSNKDYTRFSRDMETYNAIYNTTRWREVRELALKRDKCLCVHCFKENRIEKATCVDHIVEVKDDSSLAFSLDNCQSLCNRCHAIKTASERKQRNENTK